MVPTYSVSEVKALLPLLDLPQVNLLEEVCKEEANCYNREDLDTINLLVNNSRKNLAVNELQVEYLLSFN